MSKSSYKKIIPIIVILVIVIGVLAIINSDFIQDQASKTEQPSISEKTEINQEIKESPEFTPTSKLETSPNQKNEIEKENGPPEKIEPTQEINESFKQEPINKLESNQSPTKLKAAIIDQLYDEIPNNNLQANVTRMLEDAGYQVDLFTTKDITVDFYRKLPSMNYNFILIRSHGGEGDPDEEYPTRLFTGEKYATEKYTLEQLSEQVGYGFPFYDDDLREFQEKHQNPFDHAYFTIGSKFVKEGMVGTFPDSTIIVGGCQSARSHDLMTSLIVRGADHVIGWDATIGSGDNDMAMSLLLEDILVNKITLYDAVAKINKDTTADFEEDNLLKLFDAV